MSVYDGSLTTSSMYRRESARLATFVKWPRSKPSAEVMAAAGFYFYGPGDRVQCYFCAGMVEQWSEASIPMNAHRRHFPKCRFVLGENCGNIPMGSNEGGAPSTAPQ